MNVTQMIKVQTQYFVKMKNAWKGHYNDLGNWFYENSHSLGFASGLLDVYCSITKHRSPTKLR